MKELITNEYSVLYSTDGGKDKKIIPNTPFLPFKGNYKVASAFRVLDNETKKQVVIYSAGQVVSMIGEYIEPTKPKAKPRATPTLPSE